MIANWLSPISNIANVVPAKTEFDIGKQMFELYQQKELTEPKGIKHLFGILVASTTPYENTKNKRHY